MIVIKRFIQKFQDELKKFIIIQKINKLYLIKYLIYDNKQFNLSDEVILMYWMIHLSGNSNDMT